MILRRLLFLIVFFIGFIYFLTNALPSMFSVTVGWNGTDIGERLYKIDNFLSQIVKRESILQGKEIYKSQENFVKIMPKYYISMDTSELTDYKIKKNKLQDYKNKLIFNYYDNFSMAIIKFQDECKYVDIINPKDSNCVIEVDLNTFAEGPNSSKFSMRKPHKADRYMLIIDSVHDSVVIPAKYHNLVYNT